MGLRLGGRDGGVHLGPSTAGTAGSKLLTRHGCERVLEERLTPFMLERHGQSPGPGGAGVGAGQAGDVAHFRPSLAEHVRV